VTIAHRASPARCSVSLIATSCLTPACERDVKVSLHCRRTIGILGQSFTKADGLWMESLIKEADLRAEKQHTV
jgi:hypothetical protein